MRRPFSLIPEGVNLPDGQKLNALLSPEFPIRGCVLTPVDITHPFGQVTKTLTPEVWMVEIYDKQASLFLTDNTKGYAMEFTIIAVDNHYCCGVNFFDLDFPEDNLSASWIPSTSTHIGDEFLSGWIRESGLKAGNAFRVKGELYMNSNESTPEPFECVFSFQGIPSFKAVRDELDKFLMQIQKEDPRAHFDWASSVEPIRVL